MGVLLRSCPLSRSRQHALSEQTMPLNDRARFCDKYPGCSAAAGVLPARSRRTIAHGHLGFVACSMLAVVFFMEGSAAAEPSREKTTAAAKFREPLPIEDDANLHDVQFVGSRAGWAVGDRGVIWHSDDEGQRWTLQPSGVGCPLHSVCFL